MAQYARRFLWAGVKIVGGCCGTTPEHIKLSGREMRSLQPRRRSWRRRSRSRKPGPARSRRCRWPAKSQLGQSWRRANSWRSWKFCRRAAWTPREEIAGAQLCAEHGIDCINVPDGPARQRAHERAGHLPVIQQHAEIEAVNHFCCRDRNILGIQSRAAGRACRRHPQPDLHHRRSAAHGHLPGRHGGVRRRRHRPDQHRQQFESRAGYRRQFRWARRPRC